MRLFLGTFFIFSILFTSFAFATDVDKKVLTKADWEEAKSGKSLRRFMRYSEKDMATAPPYRKVFDEYILDLEYIQRFNELPKNPAKEADLMKMSVDGAIVLQ